MIYFQSPVILKTNVKLPFLCCLRKINTDPCGASKDYLLLFKSYTMQRFHGLFGIVLILGIAFLFSNNKSRINLRLVFSGLLLQITIAILVFKVLMVRHFFEFLGHGMERLEGFAFKGASFVYDGVGVQQSN